jgi:hypothetical protein
MGVLGKGAGVCQCGPDRRLHARSQLHSTLACFRASMLALLLPLPAPLLQDAYEGPVMGGAGLHDSSPGGGMMGFRDRPKRGCRCCHCVCL